MPLVKPDKLIQSLCFLATIKQLTSVFGPHDVPKQLAVQQQTFLQQFGPI